MIYGLLFYPMPTVKRKLFFTACSLLLQIPILYEILKNKVHVSFKISKEDSSRKIFFAGGIFMSVLTGLLIPSSVIKASAQEFIDINYFYHPVWFIVSAFCLAVGIFVVWAGVFYWLAKPSVKVLFDRGIWILAGIAVVNYMFFGKNLGILNTELKYEQGLDFSFKAQLWNIILMIAVVLLLYFIAERWKKQVFDLLVIAGIAISGMSIMNIVNINASIDSVKEEVMANSKMPEFSLSKKGKNVIVLMLDRAVGEYVPYIFNEKPELKEQFSGFTYYPNVISFGGYTNFGTPALLGGYEYTPAEINKRADESLVAKQNEALKVMPVLFDKNDFDVTVCDPVYANYQWIPDLSIYDEYPDIESYNTKGKFSDEKFKELKIQNNKRKFFCYSVLKSAPLCFQELLYDQGNYNQSNSEAYSGQILEGVTVAEGLDSNFMNAYNVLNNLSNITKISEDGSDTFLFMSNDTTHEPVLLQAPAYEPAKNVDNTEYEAENQNRFTSEGETLAMDSDWQMTHYHVNMAAFIQLGKWFDYLKENDVYDNTRIILVADHGQALFHTDRLVMTDGNDSTLFYPLLMVKDFNSNDFVTSEEFMTNADVPTMAMEGLIENPINPFTGGKIDSSEKTAHEQHILLSYDWDINKNNGNTFLPGTWYSVQGDRRDKNNWKVIEENEAFIE